MAEQLLVAWKPNHLGIRVELSWIIRPALVERDGFLYKVPALRQALSI